MRLDKYLADADQGSRARVKELIRKGEVTVDGALIKKPEFQVGEGACVMVGGKEISYRKYHYYMLNKPPGVVSSTEDPKDPTVLSLLPPELRRSISPVGRLDKDTVGLLLLTDDGELSHRLLSPKSHVDKVYLAGVAEAVKEQDVQHFAAGITLKDGMLCKPAKLEILTEEEVRELMPETIPGQTETGGQIAGFARVTISEGKYHQIKRMFAACGNRVCYLKRLSMGSLTLDPELAEGAYRELTEEELSELRSCLRSPLG